MTSIVFVFELWLPRVVAGMAVVLGPAGEEADVPGRRDPRMDLAVAESTQVRVTPSVVFRGKA